MMIKKILNRVELITTYEEKLPGVLSDKNLSFDIHIKSMCKKASQKISALARLSNYFKNAQKFRLLNLVIKSQLLPPVMDVAFSLLKQSF